MILSIKVLGETLCRALPAVFDQCVPIPNSAGYKYEFLSLGDEYELNCFPELDVKFMDRLLLEAGNFGPSSLCCG